MALELNKKIGAITPSFTPNYFKQAYNGYKLGRMRLLIEMFEYCMIRIFIK